MLGRAKDGVDDISLQSLRDLLNAYEHAQAVDADVWQFAVELIELRSAGLTRADIRRLIHEGLVSHGFESKAASGSDREFELSVSTRFSDESCFVLTEAGVAYAKQLPKSSCDRGCPVWNAQNRDLTLNGQLIKRYRVPAQNQEAVLSAFQEENWCRCVDDPLPPIADQCPKRRLHDTIKSLNRHHRRRLIRFCGDGTGERVIWEFV